MNCSQRNRTGFIRATSLTLFLLTLSALLGVASPGPVRPGGFFICFGGEPHQMDRMLRYYDVVVWHNAPKTQQVMREMKERNPNLTAFMYRELFCVLQEETPLEESVGHYQWLSLHHPDWFQKDLSGNRVEVPDYPGRWMMDLGNPAFQAFWIEQTLQDLLAGGWDGVFVDDALPTVEAHDLPPLLGYPDDASMQEAVYGFLQRAAQAFHAHGKLLVANVSNSYDYPGLWEKWLGVTDGLMEEHFSGEGWTWGDHVAPRQMEAMETARREGKWVFCMTYGPWEDEDRLSTSLAAYLVGAGPKAYWSYRPDGDGDASAFGPAETLQIWRQRLGQPLSGPEVQATVWLRRFQNGAVALNVGRHPSKFRYEGREILLEHHQSAVLQRAFLEPKDDSQLSHLP